jgi:hypothetical protein
MPVRPDRRALIRRLIIAQAAVAGCAGADAAAEPGDAAVVALDIVVQLADGMKTTHDQPRVVLWIEDRNHHFVRTLYRFGKKDPKHYEDLPVSFALAGKAEKPADLDAVTGATVVWGAQGHLQLPARWRGLDLLSGNFILRVESAKDHAKHFATFAIPLSRRSLDTPSLDKGYVTSVAIGRAPAEAAANPDPVMIPDPAGAPKPLPPGEVETAKAVGTVIAVTPATAKFPNLPSVTLRLDGSGDIVEYWPRKGQPETDRITKLILGCKTGARKQVVYTESKGSRALVLEDAPPGH